jgi:hypothetical protein
MAGDAFRRVLLVPCCPISRETAPMKIHLLSRFVGATTSRGKRPTNRRQQSSHARLLAIESLERRTLLSVSTLATRLLDQASPVALVTAAKAPVPSNVQQVTNVNGQTYTFALDAKAQPDQWYTGIGGPYYALGKQPKKAAGQPEVNQDYVWGMTQTPGYVWFSSSGNVLSLSGSTGGVTTGSATKVHVTQGAQSQYPGVPQALRPYLGDWRPPQIHRYNLAKSRYEDITPKDPLLNSTLGIRSAGASDTVVLFAGPSLYGVGINMFAFDAKSGKFLGSRTNYLYSDIRSWVNVNGQLYTAAARTSTQGDGVVLRWVGSTKSPFAMMEVGWLDLEGANIAAYNGRLFVTTWPLNYGSLAGSLGYRTDAHAGLWMSPPLPSYGLTTLNAASWNEVWTIDEYEPDPVVAASYGGGALASFDGYLYWGTMQVPGTGTAAFNDAYPDYTGSSTIVALNTYRPAPLFRGKDFDQPAVAPEGQPHRTVELLYGDSQLQTFTPNSDGTDGTWAKVDNKTGTPTFGQAGFDYIGNTYIWSMAVDTTKKQLYVGTFDYGTLLLGDDYVLRKGDLDAVATDALPAYGVAARMGADLYAIPAGDQQPFALSKEGLGNPLNHGVRNMQVTPQGLFIGTANSSNLLTAAYKPPTQPLHAGGWELIQMTVAATPGGPQSSKTAVKTTTVDAVIGSGVPSGPNFNWFRRIA